MSIEGGPLAYESKAEPVPLSEREEAILAFAACGLTGPALGDWDYRPEKIGASFGGFAGRTASSPDAIQTVSVFVINDEATWLARRPEALAPEEQAAIVGLARDGEFVEAWRRMRVKIRDGRTATPSEMPYNVPPNHWDLNREGTTYFLPVYEQTKLMLNVMLGAFSDAMGVYFVDDRRQFQPAGLAKYARSKGGHLHDDPTAKLTLPISQFERIAGEMCSVEQGMIMQNLALTCQAMGLAGFPHNCHFDPSAWFEALGFRMREMPSSEYLSVPWPMSWLMKMAGQETTVRFPVGLEKDGEVLLAPHTPPYYESMEEAIRALVEEKFGPGGIYDRAPAAYQGQEAARGWKHPEAVTAEVEGVSERAVETTIAHCEYLWEHHGRFPVDFPPFATVVGFQVGHADEGFYDEFYREGTLSEAHRRHMERWHGE